jgi:cytochrome c-type biogenesis protein CcmH/NrfG
MNLDLVRSKIENMSLAEAKRLFDQHQLAQAVEILDQIIIKDQKDVTALLLRGRIFYKMQCWGDAMNDYAMVLDLHPENQEAQSGLEMAKNILGYYTPDMFNP